jgi:hypothetical protein
VEYARETRNSWIIANALVNQAVTVRVLKADADGRTIEQLLKEALDVSSASACWVFDIP